MSVGAADFVGSGGDLGDGVAVEVGDEDLAAIGFEGEVDGGLADIEEVEEVVGLLESVGGGSSWVKAPGEGEDHDLMSGGAGDEGLGGVGEDDGVGGSGAVGEDGAELEEWPADR